MVDLGAALLVPRVPRWGFTAGALGEFIFGTPWD